jgi:hypothetical protein
MNSPVTKKSDSAEPPKKRGEFLAATSWVLLILGLVPITVLANLLIGERNNPNNAAYGFVLIYIGAPAALAAALLIISSVLCGLKGVKRGVKHARIPVAGCCLIIGLIVYLLFGSS